MNESMEEAYCIWKSQSTHIGAWVLDNVDKDYRAIEEI